MATMLVLIALAELALPELFPLNLSKIHSLDSTSWLVYEACAAKKLSSIGLSEYKISLLVDRFHKGLEFCKNVDRRHPLVYSCLELGPDWLSVAATLMNAANQDYQ